LAGDLGHRDVEDVEVLAPDQVQQQVEWALERLEDHLQRIRRDVQVLGDLQHRLAVHHRQRHFLLLGMGWRRRGGVLGGLAHSRFGPLRAAWLVVRSALRTRAARTGDARGLARILSNALAGKASCDRTPRAGHAAMPAEDCWGFVGSGRWAATLRPACDVSGDRLRNLGPRVSAARRAVQRRRSPRMGVVIRRSRGMWYVIEGYDGAQVLERRMAARERHLQRLVALRDEG